MHDTSFDCGKKPKRNEKKVMTKADFFRRTKKWTNKSIEIKKRDNYLCQVCIRKMYDTGSMLNYTNLSVHHAVPVNTDWDKRLDNDNLLTVCAVHHKMAEDGTIPYGVVKSIIKEQEEKEEAPPEV